MFPFSSFLHHLFLLISPSSSFYSNYQTISMEKKIHPSNGFQYYHDDPSFSDYSMKPPPPHTQAPLPLPPPPKFSLDPPSQPLKSSFDPSSSPSPLPPGDNDKSVQHPSGTYVIRFPKEQILSYPPPENSVKYESLSRRKPRRSCFCRCFCYMVMFLFTLVIIAAIAAVVFYLTFKPVALNYDISNVSISGLNLTSPAPFSPVFELSIRAENPNKKLGIYYYLTGSEVNVSYESVILGNGVLPEFFQPAKNVTVFQTEVKESGLVLAGNVLSEMIKGLIQKNVPLRLKVKAPVKIKAGAVKTWTIYIKVNCDIIVDSVEKNSKILSKNCDYKVKLW